MVFDFIVRCILIPLAVAGSEALVTGKRPVIGFTTAFVIGSVWILAKGTPA